MSKMVFGRSGASILINAKMSVLVVLVAVLSAMTLSADAATSWYASGKNHSVALMTDGTVWVSGDDNSQGQLGNGSFGEEGGEPAPVPGLTEVKAVAAGASHAIALKHDGTVWTWGGNSFGQLGDGSGRNSSRPLQVAGLKGIVAIAAGGTHSLALRKDGSIWAWGDNRLGQLGVGGASSASLPVMIASIGRVKSIAAGGYHSIALKRDGSVWTWGYNAYGELGNSSVSSKGSPFPVRVSDLGEVKSISSGKHHCVALKNDGSIWVWGSNFYSQLGNGTTKNGSLTPVMVSGVNGAIGIVGSVNHTMALMPDNKVVGWGDNGSGQWGNGVSMSGSAVPVEMRGYNEPTVIAAVVDPRSLLKQDRVTVAGVEMDDDSADSGYEGEKTAGENQGKGNERLMLATAAGF